MLYKSKTVRDERYLRWIRGLHCITCLTIGEHPLEGSDPHHIPEKGFAAIGLKTSDLRAIPLCHIHHREYHQTGRESFKQKYRLDYEFIINRLNKIWEELNV